MRLTLLLAAFAATVAAGCGGRVAKPVLTQTALDTRLSCEHLKGEHDNNQKRLAELQGEKKESSRNNAGFLLTSPLFLDTQGTFKKETEALTLRNERLVSLMTERGCAPLPEAAPAATPAEPQPE